jgi:hypothetical protein
MEEDTVTWYTAFLGVAYRYWDVHTQVLLLFNKRRDLLNSWNKVVKWWPDDEVKMRFAEANNYYRFVLYGESHILENKWVFLKILKASEYYKRFKDEYDGTAYLGFALYKPEINDEPYQLEVFNYRKKVTDVLFLEETNPEQDSMVSRSIRLSPSPDRFESTG